MKKLEKNIEEKKKTIKNQKYGKIEKNHKFSKKEKKRGLQGVLSRDGSNKKVFFFKEISQAVVQQLSPKIEKKLNPEP